MSPTQDYPISRSNRKRRDFLEKHLPIHECSILEIGALDTPVYRPHEQSIRFLDWYTTEELRVFLKDRPNRNFEHVVPVDFPVKDRFFSRHLEDRFDLVIANHVVEHIPDLIGWFHEVENVLAPGGRLLIAVPDRRFTFDILRSPSDAIELIRCHDEGLEKPTCWQIVRDLYYHRPINAEQVWSGTHKQHLDTRRHSMKDALETAKRLAEEYQSVHCHVFSHDTFPALWQDLADSGLVHMEIEALQGVIRQSNEFLVLLKARGRSR
jgi:SAM-dependent methyltransferase